MRSLLILIAVVSVGMFLAAPSLANNVGTHCVQFGDDHPGCGGGGGGGDDDDDDNGGSGDPGVFGDNTNTNTNTAFGLGIAGAGVFDSGNSSSASGATAVSGPSSAYSGVDFEDASFGNSDVATDNDQSTNVDVDARNQSTSTTLVEDRKDPVASAAPVFASACSAGISAQSYGFGGALANTNPMCDLALAVELAIKVDNFELARELVDRAARFARHRTNPIRMYGQWIPFLGQLL